MTRKMAAGLYNVSLTFDHSPPADRCTSSAVLIACFADCSLKVNLYKP